MWVRDAGGDIPLPSVMLGPPLPTSAKKSYKLGANTCRQELGGEVLGRLYLLSWQGTEVRVWKPWALVPGQGEISCGSSGKTLSLCLENRHHCPCWICCCFCYDLIVVVFVILIKAWGVFGYKGLCENEQYFEGWGWATFFDYYYFFFLVPSVGKLSLILTGRRGRVETRINVLSR